ncbi:MAG TPA: alpha-E domain-containing protein, partial [Hymenobacter sp.]
YLVHSMSGQELYLKTYRGNFNPDSVLQFVLHNAYFTHSLYSCLSRLSWYFDRLKSDTLPESHEQVEFLIGRLANQVKYTDVSARNSQQLNDFLLHTRKELLNIAVALGKTYLGKS